MDASAGAYDVMVYCGRDDVYSCVPGRRYDVMYFIV